MGTCVTTKKEEAEKNTVDKKAKACKLSEIQVEVIGMMFHDLAKRGKNNTIVTRETFEVFFHASGLMAELLFIKFDQKRSGGITKNEFVQAFEIMVKGSFEEKADVLFEFYGVENSGGVRYSELLKILFSYPLTELNKMLFEDNFLKYLGENMLTYYFGPERKIEDKTIIEETSQQSNSEGGRKHSVYSVYAPTSNEYMEMQTRIKETLQQQRKNKKIGVPDIFKKQRHSLSVPAPEQENKIGSSTQVELKKVRRTAQLKSNIASVTKRYATYLFVSLNLDKEKDVFSKIHFYKLLKDHPSIFDAYLSGFHSYIWQMEVEGLAFLNIKPWIEGSAKQIRLNKGQEKVYLKFIRTTIFILVHKTSTLPKDIINMEGLTAQSTDRVSEYGIKLTHRDGFYPEREFIFESQKFRDDWIKQLADFKENSIFDKYIKLERIGGGNFSNVYRGKEKKSDKNVAIKVIEPQKLTESERQVLKRQCGILKQCHHPNIVKYIEQFKTKTHLYIVTQLLSEGDLFEYTRRNTFLEEYQAAIIFRQLAETILYLNESGIIHRDLKPENVMIIMGQDRKIVKRVKLIDFGFGVYKDKLRDLSDREKYAGTPGFIAPQVYRMMEFDQKIDTFSLGIILYFMLYGYLPFQSNYIEEIQQMTLACNISLCNNHWSNVSDEAKDLIMKILTSADQRITTKQALDHPWLQKIERLKDYQGRNRKQRILS